MSETINGWAPPVIYDWNTDKSRVATQSYIDRLLDVENAYAALCRNLSEMDNVRSGLRAKHLSMLETGK